LNYFNYFTDIEETFIRRREKHLLLSPLDWALIESWQDRGIPLRIVLRGIENVFDSIEKNPNRKKTVKSLVYCKEEIESLYAVWLETQVGKNKQQKTREPAEIKKVENNQISEPPGSNLFSGEAIITHLENVTEAINRAKAKTNGQLRQTLEQVFSELEKQKVSYRDAESLEEELNRLESLIDDALIKNLEKTVFKKIKGEVKNNLAGHRAKMEKEVYQRTFDLMLYKKLREKADIPRLSLFYL
jgi:hypothetical protein